MLIKIRSIPPAPIAPAHDRRLPIKQADTVTAVTTIAVAPRIPKLVRYAQNVWFAFFKHC